MANSRDGQHDERWREQRNRTQGWDRGPEFERDRQGQWNQEERYSSRGEAEGERRGDWREPEWERPQSDEWGRRGEYGTGSRPRQFNPRQFNQGPGDYGEPFRERPYSASSSYTGQGGYAGHLDPYREGGQRGFGATGTGSEWGAADTGRHRLGSLTESAAASAGRVTGQYGERGGSGYEDRHSSGVSHAGRGPKGYRRSDERIREEVCERLTRSHEVDASNIEVAVHEGAVVLSGTVEDRRSKRLAEDLAQEAWGSKDVQNQIRVDDASSAGRLKPETTGGVQTTQGGSPGSILGLNPETTKR